MEKVFEEYFLKMFLIGISVILATFLYWINRRQDYFKNWGLPYVPSTPLLGSFRDCFFGKIGFYDQVEKLYNDPKVKGKPFFGFFLFHKPGLIVTDPELIRRVTVKDFSSFTNRYMASDTHDPLGHYSLFASKDALWKLFRGKLTPFFTSVKLKSIFYLMDKLSTDMVNFIDKKLDSDNKLELEAKEFSCHYSSDVIASCAFGIETNSFENPNGEFRTAAREMFKMTFWRGFELSAFFMLPQLMKLFRFKGLSYAVSKFIQTSIPHVLAEREKSEMKRNDLIDTLIELKKKNYDGESLTMDMLMAQAASFFLAGIETSAATQSFALYEIARNSEIQENVRNEIRDFMEKSEGKLAYEALMNNSEFPYLNQLILEVFRVYPVVPMIERRCDSPDGYSLEPFCDFKIPDGMPVYIPIYAIQKDEKNFENPLKFDPERFSSENIGNIKPFTYFPFGSGPRNCIGERFGLLQVKLGLIKILTRFRMETTDKTPKEIVLEKKSMTAQSDKGLYLNFVKDPLYLTS